jgi:inorganic triphosphatase YgiF
MSSFPINLIPFNELEAELKRRQVQELFELRTQIELHQKAIKVLQSKLLILGEFTEN